MSTAGFYTTDLRYAPNSVYGPGYALLKADKDTYTYPVSGWTWYDTRDAAVAASVGSGENPMLVEQQRLALIIQEVLDAQARAMNFDSILSGVSYATDRQSMFYNDAMRLTRWRSQVWEKAYEIRDAVMAGGTPPTDEELLAQLPAFVQ